MLSRRGVASRTAIILARGTTVLMHYSDGASLGIYRGAATRKAMTRSLETASRAVPRQEIRRTTKSGIKASGRSVRIFLREMVGGTAVFRSLRRTRNNELSLSTERERGKQRDIQSRGGFTTAWARRCGKVANELASRGKIARCWNNEILRVRRDEDDEG